MSRKPRTHFDATKPGAVARAALCGWLDVDTTSDRTAVTCEACKRALRHTGATRAAKGGLVPESEFLRELASVIAPLAPKAGPPPRLTAPLWAASCKGGEHRHCGSCVICVWEREAERWSAVAPWTRQHRQSRPASAPTWPSFAAALAALAEWEYHDRFGPSAMGPILDRARRGDTSDGGRSRPEDPLLQRAGDLVLVREALEMAYPEGAHAVLSRAQCMRVMMVRTLGVVRGTGQRGLRGQRIEIPSYEELGQDLGVTQGDLKALVRNGRRVVTVELAARALIPMPKPSLGLAEDIETARRRYERAS